MRSKILLHLYHGRENRVAKRKLNNILFFLYVYNLGTMIYNSVDVNVSGREFFYIAEDQEAQSC